MALYSNARLAVAAENWLIKLTVEYIRKSLKN
jgi:hypothetical protein